MRLSFWIGWRYLFTRRKESFISFIASISILGIAIGVMALIVVLAVMSGFDNDLRDKIVGTYSHIIVEGVNGIEDYQAILTTVKAIEHVEAASAYIQGEVLLEYNDRMVPVALRGINPKEEVKVTKIGQYIEQGNLDPGENSIVIGRELANFLAVGIGSEIDLTSLHLKKKFLKTTVSGIFNSGMYEYDRSLIFTNIATAQHIFGIDNAINGIGIRLDNLYSASRVKEKIFQAIPFGFMVRTWQEVNKNFFAALQLEKTTMFIILTLIVLVASFNIISCLVVMVVKKTKDIGILKAIGVDRHTIRSIFTFGGILMGFIGIAWGTGLGILLCHILGQYQFIKLPADIYYIDKLPVNLQIWPDVSLIILCAFGIIIVSTIYPAAKAARLDPVEALRYE